MAPLSSTDFALGLAQRLVSRSAHLRGARPRWGGQAPAHKEWLHFTVHGAGLDIVLNFSVTHDPELAAPVGRVGCLIHDGSWQGAIDTCPPGRLRARAGETRLRLDESQVSFRDGGFDVIVRLRGAPISLQLRLEPLAAPAQINNFEVDGAPTLNWFVVPSLRASGWVSVADRRFLLDDALAYHDHNWGGFRWGGDFSWEWGYVHAPRADWSLVFAGLSDRGHNRDLMRGLFVWKKSTQHRVFAGDELVIERHGSLRATRTLRVPPVMGLLAEGRVCDIPERFQVAARRAHDALDVEVNVRDIAQVVVPNDDDLGLTIINECRSDVSVHGRIAGETIEFQGRSIFEFLGD